MKKIHVSGNKKTSILLVGYYGHSNFGDDLILETLFEKLSPNFQLGFIDYGNRLSNRVRDAVENNDLIRIPIYTARRRVLSKFNFLLQAAQLIFHGRKYHAIAFGGGTQLFETKKNGVLPLIAKTIYIIVLRLLFRIKVVHLFVGVNAPRTKIGRQFLRVILRMSDLVILRDARSFNLSKSMGVSSKRLFLASDVAYSNDVAFARLPNPPVQSVEENPCIFVSIFPYFSVVENQAELDEDYCQRIQTLVRYVEENHGRKPCLCFVGSHNNGPLNDIVYAKRLEPHFPGCDIKYLEYKSDVEAYISELSVAKYVVAMRLHVLISCAVIGVNNLLVLPYQDKVTSEAEKLNVAALEQGNDICWLAKNRMATVGRNRMLNEQAFSLVANHLLRNLP